MKKSRKKFKTAQEAMLGVASMPVQVIDQPVDNRTGLRRFMDAEAAEEKRIEDEEARKTQALQDQISENLRKVRDAESAPIQKFWQQDLATLGAFGITKTPVDPWLTVETVATRASDAAIFETYKKFRSDIEARGVTLSEDSWSKLGSYLQAASFHGQASLAVASTWREALIRLFTLGSFNEGITGDPLSLIKTEPQPQAPQHEPSFDEVLATTSGETRDGLLTLRDAELKERSQEIMVLYSDWLKSVEQGFGWCPSAEEVKAVTGYMLRMNLPPLAHKSWNTARVACCRNGSITRDPLPLTPDERTAIAIENDPRPTSDYQARVDTAKLIGKLVRA
jgi:hypothetical protein